MYTYREIYYMEKYNRDKEYYTNLVKSLDWFSKLIETGKLPTSNDIKRIRYNLNYELEISLLNYMNLDIVNNFKSFYSGNNCRESYIAKFGFMLITKDVIDDLVRILNGSTVLELCAGTGYLSKCIKDADPSINIICTDNLSYEQDENSIFNQWKNNHYMDIECIDAIDAIEKYYKNVDYILLSWPDIDKPYATNILNKCFKYDIPIIYIGEFINDENIDNSFFKLIREKFYINNSISNSYIQFNGVHDNIYIIAKK